MKFLQIAALSFSLILLACGPASEETTENTGPKVIITDGSNPDAPPATPTRIPEPPAEAVFNQAQVDLMVETAVASALAKVPKPTPQAQNPTPEPVGNETIDTGSPYSPSDEVKGTETPEPPAKPLKFSAVSPPSPDLLPIIAGGNPVMQFTGSPAINNRVLTLSGVIENQASLAPTSLQVWQSQEGDDYDPKCSSDRPVAFVRPGAGGGDTFSQQYTAYDWQFCNDGYELAVITDKVPWLLADSWQWSMRPWRDTRKPKFYDFSVSVTLDRERIGSLEYSNPTAWRIALFAGDRLLSFSTIAY